MPYFVLWNNADIAPDKRHNRSPSTPGRYAGGYAKAARRSETGRLYVPAEWVDARTGQGHGPSDRRCALCDCESSSENRGALQSQADGPKAYSQARGYQVVHEDRLTRFGFRHFASRSST